MMKDALVMQCLLLWTSEYWINGKVEDAVFIDIYNLNISWTIIQRGCAGGKRRLFPTNRPQHSFQRPDKVHRIRCNYATIEKPLFQELQRGKRKGIFFKTLNKM